MKYPLLALVIFTALLAAVSCKKQNNPADNTAPVITMQGYSPVYVEKGTSYADAGATAWDETDGDLTASIQLTNVVDVNVEGTYHVKYNVTDKAGNKATEVVRTVIVKIF